MHRYLSIILGSLLMIPQLACAGVRTSSSGGVSIQLEDEHGQRLKTYVHKGSTYVLGHMGHRYNVRVFNGTSQRLETVVTVDGRDVISGALGNYQQQRGYVIDPYDSVLVEGFRRSMADVAAFRFTSPGDSYSGRRGTVHNVGVIGVAVFEERSQSVSHIPIQQRRTDFGGPAPYPANESAASSGLNLDSTSGSGGLATTRGTHQSGARAAKSARRHRPSTQNHLGTRFGETRQSAAVSVPFVRRSPHRPLHILAVYYDDHSGLASRGIPVYRGHGYEPSPFPRQGFAPPPF